MKKFKLLLKIYFSLSLYFVLSFSMHAQIKKTASVEGINEYMLDNGLKVIVKEDHRSPTVAHMIWYKTGAIDENYGVTGVAHVLEHMMFKGTKNLKPGEFSKKVAEVGGRDNAFTSKDYTAYFQQIEKSHLPAMMALEADRMQNLRIDKEEFAKDVDKNIFPGAQGGAINNQIAAKAVCFKEALSDDFKIYAQQILKNAKALSDSFTNEGLRVVSGGTVNHIVLVDTQSVDEELTGKEAGILLNEMGITLNRNAIPFDTRSPFVTSGIRMGTPAVTTCGMKEEQLTTVGLLISDILKNRNDEKQLSNLKAQVRDLAITHQPYA